MRSSDDAVVITGVGPITSIGSGREECWRALLARESGLAKITRFDTTGFPVKVAAEVLDIDPAATIDRRLLVATDRWTHFGLIASQLALQDAGVDLASIDPYRITVVTAAASGGNEFGQREIEALWSRGPRAVTVYQSIAWFYAATTGQLSIRHGSKGRCSVLAGGAAAGLDAFAVAADTLRVDADVALVGGTEAPISPYALTCQLDNGLLSTSDDPTEAYRPFGRDARGYVLGEGGAMCLLERAQHCRERGGRALAVVTGHGSSHDGQRATSTDIDVVALGLCEAIEEALGQADLVADDIDIVFPDGVGVADRDHAEITALRMALGPRVESVPITVPKTATGRMEAAGACFDVAIAANALATQTVPPTVNVVELAMTSPIDLVRNPRPTPLRHALVLGRTIGGANSALVLSAAE